MRRKQRHFTELADDPHFPFYVGRLLGAAEMTAHLMMLKDDPEMVEMGQRLGMVVGWFYENDPDESVTKVIPPKTGP